MGNHTRVLIATTLALGALPASAAVFTVGPGGTHASVDPAIAAANANAGDDEVRIVTGVHVGNVFVGATPAETLVVSGGWNAAFTVRSADPGLTVLDGGALAHVVYIAMAQGRVEISHLTVRNGQSFTGGGMELDASGTAQMLLSDLVVRDNLATWEFASNGGGLKINARNDATVELRDSTIRDNTTVSTANSTLGGGAYLSGSENGQILVQRCVFENNHAQAPSEPRGAGLSIDAFGQSSIEIRRSELRGNLLQGGSAMGGSGTAISAISVGTGSLTLRANTIAGNLDQSRPDGGQQVSLQSALSALVELGDNEISGGNGIGAMLSAYETSRIDLANLTIADHPGGGLELNRYAGASTSLFNSILHGNGGVEFASNAAATTGANLIEGALGAVDPRFVDAASGDYRLRAGSPAIDTGDGAPPAGIGSQDADGGTRVVGAAIDLGAYEHGSLRLFANGFEN